MIDGGSPQQRVQHLGVIALQVVDVLEELESWLAAGLLRLQSLLADGGGQRALVEIAIDLLQFLEKGFDGRALVSRGLLRVHELLELVERDAEDGHGVLV